MKIPFNKVHLQGKEIEYAAEAVKKFHRNLPEELKKIG